MNKAIFLDKDGTLIPDIPYNVDPDLITLAADTVTGLKLLYDLGYMIIVVTNQSGIGRGFFKEDKLDAVKARLANLLGLKGIKLTGFYYCPHFLDSKITGYAVNCQCCKPGPGMLLQAAKEHHIDLSLSWMIGDILNDVEAGNRAGCRSVLIDNGNETEWVPGYYRKPLFRCKTINEAADKIIMAQKHELAGL